MWVSDNWKDYELLDACGGRRLERWGEYILNRPDPQVVWRSGRLPSEEWGRARGIYRRSPSGGGAWEDFGLPESWTVGYGGLRFALKPMAFKHTGLFPEQAVNWDWMSERIAGAGRRISVLNLFAYTGGATLACAAAGAEVCHVDAARGMVAWAKENAALSGLAEAPVRYMVDDCAAFCGRELRRRRRYDAIVMDPPTYGRGPKSEVWKIEGDIDELVELCVAMLSDNPLFFIINSYTAGLAPSVMEYLLSEKLREAGIGPGRIGSGEIGLKVKSTGKPLACGGAVRWEAV